jgi:hypothetical protein
VSLYPPAIGTYQGRPAGHHWIFSYKMQYLMVDVGRLLVYWGIATAVAGLACLPVRVEKPSRSKRDPRPGIDPPSTFPGIEPPGESA